MHHNKTLANVHEPGRRLNDDSRKALTQLPESFADEASVLDSFTKLSLLELGDDIRFIVLFGSRATGKAQAHSDYDIALFTSARKKIPDLNTRVSDIGYEFVIRGANVHPVVLEESRWYEHTHFLNHIRQVGKSLHGDLPG